MRSKAHIQSHPIHPMLIPFPLAFLFGAGVADWVAKAKGDADWAHLGSILSKAGVATGLFAGVFGFIDYLYTVPPKSSAKKRATQHLLVNVATIKLFVDAMLGRRRGDRPLPWWALALETAGMGGLVVGGWLGGTLVYRNQVGVDHRYAGAGKWQETSVSAAPGESVAVARTDELQNNQMKLLRVNGNRVVLARTEQGYVAFQDRCPHKGGSLAGGVMAAGVVTCPWHGSQFDVTSGAVRSGPAGQPIATYAVEVAGGRSAPARPRRNRKGISLVGHPFVSNYLSGTRHSRSISTATDRWSSDTDSTSRS